MTDRLSLERHLYGSACVCACDPTGRFVGIGRDFGMEIFDRHQRKRSWVAWMFGGGRPDQTDASRASVTDDIPSSAVGR